MNVSYNADCVAEFTLMLMLMALRNTKRILQRSSGNDFTLKGLSGDLLCEKTVGVIGTGRIGKTVIRDLKGFGCKVYAYTQHPNPTVDAEYVSLEELFTKCNVITLHIPLASATRHIIDREAIAKMPEGVVIVNTARGGLIDSAALIEGLEEGKIKACGLDVIEDEFDLYYYDRRSTVLKNHTLAILRNMPNVVITPHMAFYSEQTVSDMVYNSLLACVLEEKGAENPWRGAERGEHEAVYALSAACSQSRAENPKEEPMKIGKAIKEEARKCGRVQSVDVNLKD